MKMRHNFYMFIYNNKVQLKEFLHIWYIYKTLSGARTRINNIKNLIIMYRIFGSKIIKRQKNKIQNTKITYCTYTHKHT